MFGIRPSAIGVLVRPLVANKWMAQIHFWKKNIRTANALRAELLSYVNEIKDMEERRARKAMTWLEAAD